jgi:hypothetical protein
VLLRPPRRQRWSRDGRLAAALVALSALLSGCVRNESEQCPGEVFAALALHGTLTSSGCLVPPASGWSVPEALPDVTPTASDPVPTFAASFAWDEAASLLAYCTGDSHAAPLLGTRTGDHLRAERTLDGAVLSSCASTCAPLTTLVVEGDLTGGSGGLPLAFTGTLTETLDASAGSCGACVLPCTSVYDLAGESR